MQKDSQVSARDLQNLTNFFGVHSFDLTQVKGHPLVGWNPVQTAVNSLAHLSSVNLCVHRERRPCPTPGVIKPLLEDLLDSYSKCNKPPDRTPQRS